MSAPQWGECPTGGCMGDARYAAPGRGHGPHCLYPFPVSQHDDDERTAYERAVLGRILAEARAEHEIPDWIAAITGAMIDARPLLRSAQAPDDAIERAARVLALVDDYDGCFERIDEWERTPVEDRWEIEEPGSDDYESADDWRKKARALAAAGLLAPPARESGATRDDLIDDLIDALGWDWPDDPEDPNVPPLRDAVGGVADELGAKGWARRPGRSEAEIKAEAWDEGHAIGAVDAANLAIWNRPPTPNPYRAARVADDREVFAEAHEDWRRRRAARVVDTTDTEGSGQ